MAHNLWEHPTFEKILRCISCCLASFLNINHIKQLQLQSGFNISRLMVYTTKEIFIYEILLFSVSDVIFALAIHLA